MIKDSPEQRTFLVSRESLRSEQVFGDEQAAIWDRHWLWCAHESEIPKRGDFLTRTVGGRPLLIVRDRDDKVRVFLNSCPHKGTLLCRESRGNARFFRCFYHAWTFSSEGALVALPDEAGYSECDPQPRERFQLSHTWATDVVAGFVFVSFGPPAQPLRDWLGDVVDYLELVMDMGPHGMESIDGALLYHVRANWKLAVENALDAYHFAPTHQTFIEYRKDTGYVTSNKPGEAVSLGNGHVVHISRGRYGRAGLDWEPSWGDEERRRIEQNRADLVERLGPERAESIADTSRILFVFPNLLVFDILGVALRMLEPVGPASTEVTSLQLAPVGEATDTRRLRLDHLIGFLGPGGFSTPDDIEAYEAIQQGVQATRGDGRAGGDWNDVSRGYAEEVAGKPAHTYHETSIRSFWRFWNTQVQGGGSSI
jgi:phenylpropionate dioxygenase-like ring-hydroxylating dioxygenase large terminal subunit